MRCVASALSGASFILAALSYSGCAGRQPREDPAYVYHREAVNAYMERQYADALSLLETSLLLGGGNIVSWAHKGLFEEKLGDDEAALASYSRSIELIEKSKPWTYRPELPFYAGVYQARAGVRERLGEAAGAREDSLKVGEYRKKIKRSDWWRRFYYWFFGV